MSQQAAPLATPDAPWGATATALRRTLDASSLADRAYQVLREEILQRVHRPGTRLDIQALARDLGISTAPLRDAVRRLAADGLVSIHPRRGTFVTDLSLEDVREAYEVRRIIESAAARKVATSIDSADQRALTMLLDEAAAQLDGGTAAHYDRFIQLDAEFHRRIMLAASNRRLMRFHESLHAHTQIVRAKYAAGLARGRQTLREHRAILKALRLRDPELAEQAVGAHLDAALADLSGHLQNLSGDHVTPRNGKARLSTPSISPLADDDAAGA